MGYRDKMIANLKHPDEPGHPPYDASNPPDFPNVHLETSGRRASSFNQQQKAVQISKENMRQFIIAGSKFSTGTDTNSALNFQQEDPMVNEMMSMVEMGMSPVDVIVASTRNGAEALGLVKDLGTVEKGKLADVIVVAGNPLQHMDAMKRVAYVVKDGVRYK
jgi:imidazolonepropionase-like amidohydrolase